MHDLLVGTALIAAFLGGAVALFAPCCISVMLPAYFASSFERKRALVSMTFVFALGVSAVILPIAFGATGISRVISGHHTAVFLAGGLLMVGMGLAMVAGRRIPLPMPGMRARKDRGPAAVFALGAFSGTASACCAPVLAGVVALSGAASSFLAALAIGVTYVFGMVVPLFVIALLWDRYDWGESALLRGKTFEVRLRRRTLRFHSTDLVGGLLLVVMGALVIVLAFTGPSMPNHGWQVDLSARLQHYAHDVVGWFSHVPGWAVGGALAGALGLLVWRAVRQVTGGEEPVPPDEPAVPAQDRERVSTR